METGLPIISSERYPYIFSAALFQLRIVPSSVLLKMASSDDSTIDANNCNRLRISGEWLFYVADQECGWHSPLRARAEQLTHRRQEDFQSLLPC